ncbi:glutathione S-transferase [Fennellomyces sp. T-0311]|nr:glutathione S-transferase [Fennellomyces sp. T-0311]
MVDLSSVKLYYFDFHNPSYRGENIKLLLEDAAIPYEYIIYKWKEWPQKRDAWIAAGGLEGALPVLETADGKRYGMTVPIMRFLSKQLGKYYGSNADEEHWVDVVTDLTNDWYDAFNQYNEYMDGADFEPTSRAKYLKEVLPKHLDRIERFYKAKEGPYALGSEISFADFMVYHMIKDDQLTQLPPHLAALVKAFEERPNIKKYLATL